MFPLQIITHRKQCPVWKRYNEKFFNLTEVKNIYDKHREKFEYLQTHSGLIFSRDDMKQTSFNLHTLFDTLQVEVSQCGCTILQHFLFKGKHYQMYRVSAS